MKRLREVLERVAPRGVLEAGLVLAAWRETAESVGSRAHPAEFRSGRLTVYAPTEAEACTLRFQAWHLRARINERLPCPYVREIRVVARRE